VKEDETEYLLMIDKEYEKILLMKTEDKNTKTEIET